MKYPLYVREEAARLFNAKGPVIRHDAETVATMNSGLVICDLLMNGCEPVKEPVDPVLKLARELYASTLRYKDIKDGVIEGNFDTDKNLKEILIVLRANNIGVS